MKARQLISSASFEPRQLEVIYQAFDEAWQAIAADTAPDAIEVARLRLANIILQLASAGANDAPALKSAALQHLSEGARPAL